MFHLWMLSKIRLILKRTKLLVEIDYIEYESNQKTHFKSSRNLQVKLKLDYENARIHEKWYMKPSGKGASINATPRLISIALSQSVTSQKIFLK